MHTQRETEPRTKKRHTHTKNIDLVVCTRDLRLLSGRKGSAWVAGDRAGSRDVHGRVQRAMASSSLLPEPLVPALWRLAVRKWAAEPAATGPRGMIAGLVLLLVVDADGGRAVPTVDGGLGSTVPGGRPRDAPGVVDVLGRETGGLLLAWARGYDGGRGGGAAEAAVAGRGEVGGCGGLRRAPVEV